MSLIYRVKSSENISILKPEPQTKQAPQQPKKEFI